MAEQITQAKPKNNGQKQIFQNPFRFEKVRFEWEGFEKHFGKRGLKNCWHVKRGATNFGHVFNKGSTSVFRLD